MRIMEHFKLHEASRPLHAFLSCPRRAVQALYLTDVAAEFCFLPFILHILISFAFLSLFFFF